MQVNTNQIQERRKESIIDLLTLKEVAELCRVSVATVKYWMSMRKISYVKLGKHPLIKRVELLRFISAAESVSAPSRTYLNSNPSHA